MEDAKDLSKEEKINQDNIIKEEKPIKSRSTSKDKKSEKTSRSSSKDKKEKKSSKSKEKKQRQKSQEKEEEDDKEDISIENNIENQDLYSLLGLKKGATHEEIRKAYRSLVFKIHPDKNKNDPEASSKFANINKAYKILSNEETRKLYDETGEYDENEGRIDIMDTLNYFRKIYSTKDIEDFEKKYIGSLDEEEDLKNHYIENNGNITNILECIPCSKNEDVERFINIFENLFRKKILKKNKNYEKSKNKIKLLKEDKKEENEAKETLDKLTQQIMLNQKKRNFNDYLNCLANKYGKNDISKEGDNQEEISEEEFQKISNRLNKEKKKRNKKNKK